MLSVGTDQGLVDFSRVRTSVPVEGFQMPKAFPKEFRRDVVAVGPKGKAPIMQVAEDFGSVEAFQIRRCTLQWVDLVCGNACEPFRNYYHVHV